jgi:hypothetical protein
MISFSASEIDYGSPLLPGDASPSILPISCLEFWTGNQLRYYGDSTNRHVVGYIAGQNCTKHHHSPGKAFLDLREIRYHGPTQKTAITLVNHPSITFSLGSSWSH